NMPVRVPITANPQRVVVAAGAVVSGEVLGPMQGPVALQLEHDATDPCWTGLGERARTSLRAIGVTPNTLAVQTTDDRRFAFAGLPTNWTGAVISRDGWTLREVSNLGAAENDTTLLLMAPMRDLVLELQAPVVVRGRLLAGEHAIA